MKRMVTGWLTWMLLFSVAQSQDKQVGGGLQIAKLNGTVGAIIGNQVKLTTEEKEEFFAVVGPDTNIRYSGTAEPGFLTPGVLVRFNAELNAAGMAASPVKKIEVFTYNQSRRISPEQMRDQTPGAYQLGDDAGVNQAVASNAKKPPAGDPKKPVANSKKPPTKSSAKKPSANSGQEYRVVGVIGGVQGKKVMVQAGGAQVQFDLDPKAEIAVNSSDSNFFQIGDEIKITGLRMANQEKFVQCETLEVTGKKPLAAPEANASGRNSKIAKGRDDKSKGKPDSGKLDAGKPGTKAGADKADPKKPASKKPVKE